MLARRGCIRGMGCDRIWPLRAQGHIAVITETRNISPKVGIAASREWVWNAGIIHLLSEGLLWFALCAVACCSLFSLLPPSQLLLGPNGLNPLRMN